MKRYVPFPLCLILLLAVFRVEHGFTETLKIATLSPMTGAYIDQGTDIIHGVKVAADEVLITGGVPGFSGIEVLSYDSACNAAQAAESARKIVESGAKAVIGTFCSHAAMAATDILSENKVLTVTPAAFGEEVTDRGLPYVFRTCGRNDDQSDVVVKFMKAQLGMKTIYLVDDGTLYSQGLASNIISLLFKGRGVQILGHARVPENETNYSGLLEKVKALNPDVFFIAFTNPEKRYLITIQAAGYDLRSKLMFQNVVFSTFKKVGEGTFFTYGSVDFTHPVYLEFLNGFKDRFGLPQGYSNYAYDSAMSVFKAIRAAGSIDPDRINQEMFKLSFDGASGRIEYNSNGDNPNSTWCVYTVRNNQIVKFWEPAKGRVIK